MAQLIWIDLVQHAAILVLLGWAMVVLQLTRIELQDTQLDLQSSRTELVKAWADLAAWRVHHAHVIRLQQAWFRDKWRSMFGAPPPVRVHEPTQPETPAAIAHRSAQ